MSVGESKFDLPQSLLEAAASGSLVPFVGSGSSLAVSAQHFPTWGRLLASMADSLENNAKQQAANAIRGLLPIGELFKAAELAERHLKGDFAKVVKKAVGHKSQPESASLDLPDAIWGLHPKLIVTTNYDRILEWNNRKPEVCCNDDDEIASVMTEPTPESPWVWHLHGHVSRGRTLIVSPRQYATLYGSGSGEMKDQEAGLSCLESLFRDRTLLFIGFGLQDEYVMQTIRRVLDRFNHANRKHYALMKAGEDNTQALWDNYQIQVVTYPEHGEPLVRLLKRLATDALVDERAPAETPVPPSTAQSFRIKAKGSIDRLQSEIRKRIKSVSDVCRRAIDERFEVEFEKRSNDKQDLVDWLIHECPATKAVSRFNGIADQTTSPADASTLGQISRRLIPLHYYAEIEEVRKQLASNTFEVVTSKNSAIAEVILASYDARPIQFHKESGVTALEFLESGDYGYGEQIDARVEAFFRDLLSAWDVRFGRQEQQSTGDSREDLVRRLKARVLYLEEAYDRTVYCLLRLPDKGGRRDELEAVLQRAATLVPNLVFCHIGDQADDEDELLLTCISRIPE